MFDQVRLVNQGCPPPPPPKKNSVAIIALCFRNCRVIFIISVFKLQATILSLSEVLYATNIKDIFSMSKSMNGTKKNFLTLSETLRHNFWKIKKLSTFCSSCFNNAVYTAFIHNEKNHIASLITPIKYVFFLEEKKNEMLGAFYSTKKSGLNFWQLPVARRRTFSKISKKIDYGKSPICPHG